MMVPMVPKVLSRAMKCWKGPQGYADFGEGPSGR